MSTAAQSAPRKPTLTIKGLLEGEQFRQQVAKSLPSHLKPDRFIRVALTTMMRTPKLAQCDQASFFNALLTLSQLGIEPDGRRAHLIPFENRKRNCVEVQLIIDYKGLAELAMRSGVVANLHADVVCESDVFDYDRGQIVQHKIDFRQPRGNPYAVYAICRFKDGTEKAEVMSREEVEEVRKRSRAGNAGPWVTDWAEMAKKTVFRRLSKWLPLSAEFRDAAEADDEPAVAVPAVAIAPEPALYMPGGEELITYDPAEAQAGLAPEAEPQPSEPKPKAAEAKQPQAKLAELVAAYGCTFDQFQEIAAGLGVPGADSFSTFSEVSTDTATRLLRAQAALIRELEAVKGGAK